MINIYERALLQREKRRAFARLDRSRPIVAAGPLLFLYERLLRAIRCGRRFLLHIMAADAHPETPVEKSGITIAER